MAVAVAGDRPAGARAQDPDGSAVLLETVDLCVGFGGRPILSHISLGVPPRGLTAVIGPSGCGKSTLLRSFNRMNDRMADMRLTGRVLFMGADLYRPEVDPVALRRQVGMVFQKPVVFPMSVFDNVAYAARIHRLERSAAALADRVERCLRDAGLWDEVKDRLRRPAAHLSGGQQQRLAVARTLAVDPEVILLDEPTSAIDPVATAHIEDTLQRLAERFTIVLVTHNLQQAARVSVRVAFIQQGELVEYGPTVRVFHHPSDRRTEDYLTGRTG